MATPANASYKLSQRASDNSLTSGGTLIASAWRGKPAIAIRNGKMMKSGRRRTTGYTN